MANRRPVRRLAIALGTLLALATGYGASAAVQAAASSVPASQVDTATPSPPYRQWLEEVALLLTEAERQAFSRLRRDYQREAFIEHFWRERDPYPETPRNEFRESWNERLEAARERPHGLHGDQAEALLLLGAPQVVDSDFCPQLLRPLEVWSYERSERLPGGLVLMFVAGSGSTADALVHWAPGAGWAPLLESPVTPGESTAVPPEALRPCHRGRQLMSLVDRAVDWRRLQAAQTLVPQPDEDWVDTFLEATLELTVGRPTLSAAVVLEYPGHHQSWTVVQGLLTVAREEVELDDGDPAGYSFRLDGEIVQGNRLSERFRYRFIVPASTADGDRIPLAMQRYLRPGDYTLILRLEDLVSGNWYQGEMSLHVPAVTPGSGQWRGVEGSAPAATWSQRLTEANAVLSASEHSVEILPVPERLLTGRVRVAARVAGDNVARVTFVLNGREVMSKTRPPYSVEIDLGPGPRLHTLEAVARDPGGHELARDRVPVNGGPHRFAVRLLEPRPGKLYRQSLRAWAEVDLPAGERVERVDFFLNETRVASLFQPPFVQPLWLPRSRRISYVRAVARLADGNATEDLVFINAPEHTERLRINMVELYTSVNDRRGTPIADLQRENFTVQEEGVNQSIARFERVRDLPIHAGILLDASTSMAEELDEAVKAALRFFSGVLQPKDRAAVVVFNDFPILKVPFTNHPEVLAGGLAEVRAEGDTALYDSLVFTLYYFAGIKGKRALILLSDGQDSKSRHSFKECLHYVQRSGVAIYTIGLGLPHRDIEARSLLLRLARETGGRSFFIASARELESIYAAIEEELRSQYLLAYQSSHDQGGPFRRVEVIVHRPGLEAKTIPGYYP